MIKEIWLNWKFLQLLLKTFTLLNATKVRLPVSNIEKVVATPERCFLENWLVNVLGEDCFTQLLSYSAYRTLQEVKEKEIYILNEYQECWWSHSVVNKLIAI